MNYWYAAENYETYFADQNSEMSMRRYVKLAAHCKLAYITSQPLFYEIEAPVAKRGWSRGRGASAPVRRPK